MPLLAQALLIAALAALLLSRKRRAAPSFLDPLGGRAGRSPALGALRCRWKLLALLPAVLSLAPLGEGVSLAMMLRGLWGDFSVTSLQLLVLCLAGRPAQALGWRGPALIAAVATLFYPLALGLGDFDPYRLGYSAWPLLAVFGAAALAAWWRGQPIWLWLLTIDILAWAAGLLESPNLWDTLLDPLLAAAMLILALRNGWRTYKIRP